MANLAEASTWDTVYQLESTDQALAGAGGTMNRQAQALLNRTKFLADTKLNAADFKTQINASGTAPIYACRAWVNFNGTGTVAIRASGNVSSITDNGVSDYTINFTTAMQDANYSACISGIGQIGTNSQWIGSVEIVSMTASTLRIAQSGTSLDSSIVCASIFR